MAKMDMSKVKDFFFLHGEKVAVGACGLIAAYLIFSALSGTLGAGQTSSGKTFDKAISEKSQSVNSRLNVQRPGGEEGKVKPIDPVPPYPSLVADHLQGPLMNIAEQPDTLRRNPRALNVYSDPKKFQMDVIMAGASSHLLNYENQTVYAKAGASFGVGGAGGAMKGPGLLGPGGRGMPPGGGADGGMMPGAANSASSGIAENMTPTTMVVVSAAFPIRDQLEEYRKALRMERVEDLFNNPRDLPTFRGLWVHRMEVAPDGKLSAGVDLYTLDFKSYQPKLHPQIEVMFKEIVYDEPNPRSLAHAIFPGLVTPIPHLQNGKYPKLKIDGIEQKDEALTAGGPGDPRGMMPPGGPAGSQLPGVGGGRPGGVFPGVGGKDPAAGGGGAAVNARLEYVPWKKVPKELQDKYHGRAYPFHPLGVPQVDEKGKGPDPKGMPGGRPGMMPGMMPGMAGGEGGGAGNSAFGWEARQVGGGMGGPGGVDGLPGAGASGGLQSGTGVGRGVPPGEGGAGGAGAPPVGVGQTLPNSTYDDALVRFVDPTVVEGKTYVYFIQVRLANPNFDRRKEVSYKALADAKELYPAPPVATPKVTIPTSYHLYVLDQYQVDRNPSDKKPPVLKPNETTVQIHRWTGKHAQDREVQLIGDWVVAERVVHRRGDVIGRGPGGSILTQAPVWKIESTSFIIPSVPYTPPGKKTPTNVEGSLFDLAAGLPSPPLLVDFDGGKKTAIRVGSAFLNNDEAAVEALILNPDGTLTVHNSRIDADGTAGAGKEREERLKTARDRLKDAKGSGANAAPAGSAPGALPGV